jgi:hypothetical protein
MQLEDLLSHIEENDPYKIIVKKHGKNVLATTHDDTVSKKLDKIKKFASMSPGVYTVLTKQTKNTRDDNATVFEEVAFGTVTSQNNYTQTAPPKVDIAKITKEVEDRIRKEKELSDEILKYRRAKTVYIQKTRDLDTASGKMAYMLGNIITGFMPAMGAMNQPIQGTSINAAPNEQTTSLEVDDGSKQDNIRIHAAVVQLLQLMTVDEFVLLSETLKNNPHFVTMLKQFIPKP